MGNILNFLCIDPEQISCVLVGQDPYVTYQDNIPYACGFSFAVDPRI